MMDHDASTNAPWDVDKVLLKPGIVVDILNNFARRERDLLEANNRLLERARKAEAEPVQIKKTVEDYALAVMTGVLAASAAAPSTMPQFAGTLFGVAEAMVAERDKRGL